MFNRVLKTGVFVLALISFGSAQALPISGAAGFTGYGEFTSNGTTLNGFDFGAHLSGNTAGTGHLASSYWATGTIGAMSGNFPSPQAPLYLYDFNFESGPYVEWVLGPLTAASGATGNLVFTVTSGAETVAQNFDGSGGSIAGSGVFSFVWDGVSPAVNTATDYVGSVVGDWSLTKTDLAAQIDFATGANVPAPATIGLLGLGLLGLGAARRRREAK